MAKDVDELRAKIGSKKFDKIKAFIDQNRAKGKSPDEIAAAVKIKFAKDVQSPETWGVFVVLPPAP